jgi:CubicO group peptidase (beta-lactamase class C family)
MRAVQDGLLKLDENVNDVLRAWKAPENSLAARQAVTLRELLSMTAGTTVPGFEGYERGKPLPTLEQVLLLLSVVHESFADYIRDKVLAPMGMAKDDSIAADQRVEAKEGRQIWKGSKDHRLSLIRRRPQF